MDEAVVCPNCGCPTGKSAPKLASTPSNVEDKPNGGLNVLGFLVPLAGLIMFCTMVGKTPTKAKQIGMFSIIGFIVNFILIILMMDM